MPTASSSFSGDHRVDDDFCRAPWDLSSEPHSSSSSSSSSSSTHKSTLRRRIAELQGMLEELQRTWLLPTRRLAECVTGILASRRRTKECPESAASLLTTLCKHIHACVDTSPQYSIESSSFSSKTSLSLPASAVVPAVVLLALFVRPDTLPGLPRRPQSWQATSWMKALQRFRTATTR